MRFCAELADSPAFNLAIFVVVLAAHPRRRSKSGSWPVREALAELDADLRRR